MKVYEIIDLFRDLRDSAQGGHNDVSMDDVLAARSLRVVHHFEHAVVDIEFPVLLGKNARWKVQVNWSAVGAVSPGVACTYAKAMERASTFAMIAERSTLANLELDPPADAMQRVDVFLDKAREQLGQLPENASAPAREKYRQRLAELIYELAVGEGQGT